MSTKTKSSKPQNQSSHNGLANSQPDDPPDVEEQRSTPRGERRKSVTFSDSTKPGAVTGASRSKCGKQRAASHQPKSSPARDSAHRALSSRSRSASTQSDHDLSATVRPIKTRVEESNTTSSVATCHSRQLAICACGVLLFLILIATGILCWIWLTGSRVKEAEPLNSVYAPFLPSFTTNAIAADGSSPQARALNWLLDHEDYDTMPDWRKRQLIALLTLQYSLDVPLVPEHRETDPPLNDLLPEPQSLSQPLLLVPKEKQDECNWQLAIDCSPDGRYQELRLFWGGLKGTIPPEVSFLTALTSLSLRGSELTGPLPSELGALTVLTSLYLHDNRLTGSIPQEVGAMSSLVFLTLYNNQFSGPLPPEMGQLTDLLLMSLGGNEFTGNVPAELGALTALTSLSLNDNNLSGSIPSSLAQATNLERLILYGNSLTGTINESDGICRIPYLTSIVVDCDLVTCHCSYCGCHRS